MGLSKEEFLELMVRNEFGKKTTKRNKAIREARQKENDYNNFRFEGREKNIKRGKKKKVPTLYIWWNRFDIYKRLSCKNDCRQ